MQPTSEERIPKTIEIKSITHGESQAGTGGGVLSQVPRGRTSGQVETWSVVVEGEGSEMLSRIPAGPGQSPLETAEFPTKKHGQGASLLHTGVSLASSRGRCRGAALGQGGPRPAGAGWLCA